MKSLVIYNKINNSLECDNKERIPETCKKFFNDKNKHCQKHYKALLNETRCEKICPYGFYTIVRENNIYSSLVISEINESKVIKKMRQRSEKYSKECVLTYLQTCDYIDDYEKICNDTKRIRQCIHDLNNIGGYFNSMISQVENKYPDLEKNDDIKSIFCLYEMMNYRLSLTSAITESGYRRIILKTHPLLDKLRIMMSYKSRKKDIKITLESKDIYIEGSHNLYLAMFILLDNAIKNAPGNSEVSIYYSDISNDFVTINVENIGPIILEREKQKIFMDGFRGKNVKSSGNGIGLYIFKEIADKAGYKYNIKTKRINDNEDLITFGITLKRKSEEDFKKNKQVVERC